MRSLSAVLMLLGVLGCGADPASPGAASSTSASSASATSSATGTNGGSSGASSSGSGPSLDGLTLSAPLVLSPTTLTAGQTITASATLYNPTSAAITITGVGIGGRPPGGTDADGPFDDFYDSSATVTIAAGQSLVLSGQRTIAATDPIGTWYAFVTVADTASMYHDGPNVYFTVVGPGGASTAATASSSSSSSSSSSPSASSSSGASGGGAGSGSTTSSTGSASSGASSSSGVGGTSSSGGATGPVPQSVQLLLQGEDYQAQSGNGQPGNPDHITIGWHSVSGATSYKIYRRVCTGYNDGTTNTTSCTPYSLLTTAGNAGTVTAAQASSAYASYVTGSSIAGKYAHQTSVDSAFQDTNATNAVGWPEGSGPVFFEPSTGYTYKVSAIVDGAEGPLSDDSIFIYFANGLQISCEGTFCGSLVFSPPAGAPSPGTTPLGFDTAALWTIDSTATDICPFSGDSSVNENINIKGFNYLVLNVEPVTFSSAGYGFQMEPELEGDYTLYPSGTQAHSQSYGTLTAGQWTTLKIPLSELEVDKRSGTNAQQYGWYKMNMNTDVSPQPQQYFLEWYFSVN